jgi:hypothetical protein
LEALAPDQVKIAVAAVDQMTNEARQIEQQWSLRRERARYEAERARRQYDAVEPENRLVARSLERAWEDRLRAADAVEQEYRQWRQRDPIVLQAEDYKALEALASDLPTLWRAPTTRPEERKRILRLIIQEVLLDQKRSRGEVWVKIIWQTGAVSEHRMLRRVHSYNDDYADLDYLRDRIIQLNAEGLMDKQVAAVLNKEGVVSARQRPFTYENVWVLRKRWGLPAVKLNPIGANPPQWPDGSYSVQGAAAALGVTTQVIFDYLTKGLLTGRQIAKGQPWQGAVDAARRSQVDVLDDGVLPQRRELEARGQTLAVAFGRLAIDHQADPLLEGESGDVRRSALVLEGLGHSGQAEGDQTFMRGMGKHRVSFLFSGSSRGRGCCRGARVRGRSVPRRRGRRDRGRSEESSEGR